MSRRTFEQLITAYGVAAFDLGTCVDADEAARQAAREKRDAAREDLMKALRKAGVPIAAVAAV